MTTETVAATKPDFRIYEDETTEYWADDIARRAGKLWDVYAFDANRRVHCCEIMPSYEMNYIGPTWDGTGPEAPGEDDDRAKDKLFDDILMGGADTDDTTYIHCANINAKECEILNFSDEQWAGFLRDADGDAEEAYRAALDKLIEYCQGNGYVY